MTLLIIWKAKEEEEEEERDRQRKGQTDKRMSKEIVHEKEQRKMHFKMDIQNVWTRREYISIYSKIEK